jgi:hypothetical protein
MTRFIRRVVTAGAALAVAGCGLGSEPFVIGVYELRQVGSSSLPVTLGGGTRVVVSQTVDLRADRTVTVTEVGRAVVNGTPQGEETGVFEGTWTRRRNEVTVTTARDQIRYAVENDGHTLRSVAVHSFGASLDVLYEFLLTRPD